MFYAFYSNKTPSAYLLTDKSVVRLCGNEYFFGRFLKIIVRFWKEKKAHKNGNFTNTDKWSCVVRLVGVMELW